MEDITKLKFSLHDNNSPIKGDLKYGLITQNPDGGIHFTRSKTSFIHQVNKS
jgi:hypothetical protein